MRYYNYSNRRATPSRVAGDQTEPEGNSANAGIEVDQWD